MVVVVVVGDAEFGGGVGGGEGEELVGDGEGRLDVGFAVGAGLGLIVGP